MKLQIDTVVSSYIFILKEETQMYTFNASMSSPAGSKVLSPHQVFDYASYVKTFWPQHKFEPMFGFKILMRDTMPGHNPGDKVNYIEQNSQFFFAGRNCMMREGELVNINDYFLISLPVPRSMLINQIQNISGVLQMLGEYAGLQRQATLEINVSGRTNMFEIQNLMSSIVIPPQYVQKMVPYSGMMMGNIQFLSNEFACIRTKWNIPEPTVLDDMLLLAQLISAVFH